MRETVSKFIRFSRFIFMNTKFKRLFIIAIILIIPKIIGIYSPQIDKEESWCPFLRFFHIPCPGCGLTKSIIHFYKGEIIESFQYHYWGGIFVIFCCVLEIFLLIDIFTGKDNVEHLLNKAYIWKYVALCTLLTYLGRYLIFT